MGQLMSQRKTFVFPGSVSNCFLTKDKKHLVLNGSRLHHIDKNITTKLLYNQYKLGDAVIEYDREKKQSWIYTYDDTYIMDGQAFPNMNKITFGNGEHFYDTMDRVDDYSYDPKIDKYIQVYADGFSIATRHSLELSPEQIIVGMDRGTLTDSCYYQCDRQMFAFSETMRYVTYVYKNTLYFGETTYPFRLYVSEKLTGDIMSVSMSGMSPVVSHDTNRVTVFNYLRN